MLFSLICHGIDDGFELRKQTRPAHLAFLGSQSVRFAGPILSEDESKPIGSIVVIDCKNSRSAEYVRDIHIARIRGARNGARQTPHG